MIEHVGLVASLSSLCSEFGREKGIGVEADLSELGRRPPPSVVLSLYRITQEGLQNVRKHSQAKTVRVSLTERDERLRLVIADDGVGFDPDRIANKQGLGLVSMKERVRLLQGTLRIRSSPSAGTVVEVSVPHRHDTP